MESVRGRLAHLSPDERARLLEAVRRRGSEFNAFPLSFAQQRLWFLHRWDPRSSAYNLPGALDLAGSLDIAALEKSLREIERRHEVFRTRFVEIGGEPFQVVGEE